MLGPAVEIHHPRAPAVGTVGCGAPVPGVAAIRGIEPRELADLTIAISLPRVVETDVVAEVDLLGIGEAGTAEVEVERCAVVRARRDADFKPSTPGKCGRRDGRNVLREADIAPRRLPVASLEVLEQQDVRAALEAWFQIARPAQRARSLSVCDESGQEVLRVRAGEYMPAQQ